MTVEKEKKANARRRQTARAAEAEHYASLRASSSRAGVSGPPTTSIREEVAKQSAPRAKPQRRARKNKHNEAVVQIEPWRRKVLLLSHARVTKLSSAASRIQANSVKVVPPGAVFDSLMLLLQQVRDSAACSFVSLRMIRIDTSTAVR